MKPTEAMIAAGLRELQNWSQHMPEADAREMLDDIWRAMERARTAPEISDDERQSATALSAAWGCD